METLPLSEEGAPSLRLFKNMGHTLRSLFLQQVQQVYALLMVTALIWTPLILDLCIFKTPVSFLYSYTLGLQLSSVQNLLSTNCVTALVAHIEKETQVLWSTSSQSREKNK